MKAMHYQNCTDRPVQIVHPDGRPEIIDPGAFIMERAAQGRSRRRTTSRFYDRYVGRYGIDQVPLNKPMVINDGKPEGLRAGLPEKEVVLTDTDPTQRLVLPHAGTFNPQRGLPKPLRREGKAPRGPLLRSIQEAEPVQYANAETGVALGMPFDPVLLASGGDDATNRIVHQALRKDAAVAGSISPRGRGTDINPTTGSEEFDDGVRIDAAELPVIPAGKEVPYAPDELPDDPVESEDEEYEILEDDPKKVKGWRCPFCAHDELSLHNLSVHVAELHKSQYLDFTAVRDENRIERPVLALPKEESDPNTTPKRKRKRRR